MIPYLKVFWLGFFTVCFFVVVSEANSVEKPLLFVLWKDLLREEEDLLRLLLLLLLFFTGNPPPLELASEGGALTCHLIMVSAPSLYAAGLLAKKERAAQCGQLVLKYYRAWDFPVSALTSLCKSDIIRSENLPVPLRITRTCTSFLPQYL